MILKVIQELNPRREESGPKPKVKSPKPSPLPRAQPPESPAPSPQSRVPSPQPPGQLRGAPNVQSGDVPDGSTLNKSYIAGMLVNIRTTKSTRQRTM